MSWMDIEHIDALLSPDGAGGVRQVGRYLLISKAGELKRRIEEKCTTALKGLGTSAIDVYIFAGISGGTGSGCFLDTCYIARQALLDNGWHGSGNILGLFFLPDVVLDKPAVRAVATAVQYNSSNGYAAMKELDYLMSLKTANDRFYQNYGKFIVNTQEPPVDMCHLISATQADGSVMNDGYSYGINVAADYVIAYLAKVEGAIGDGKRDYASKTMKNIKQTAVRIMKVAVESALIMRNPFPGVVIPSKDATVRQPLTQEQIALVTNNWRGHRIGHMGMIMLYAGLRKGECLALNWEDIDLDKRVIKVNKSRKEFRNRSSLKPPKTKAGIREVPIPDILLSVLIERKKPHGLVCPSAKGVLMSGMAYKRVWYSYMLYLNECAGGVTACGPRKAVWKMEQFTAHQMRHTYATMLFDAGVDIKSAQKFLGHSDIEVTLDIYTHLTKFKEDAAIAALNAHLSNGCGTSSNT